MFFSIVRTFSFKRIINFAYSIINYFFLKVKVLPNPNNQPITITLELSSICDLACPECPTGMGKVKRDSQFMSFEMAKTIIDAHSKSTMVAILYFQGEPFLNPHWFDIISYAHTKRLYTLISTNAQSISLHDCEKIIESGLDQLIISADGAEQAVYEQYRVGGNFSKITDTLINLKTLKESKRSKTPKVIYQTLLSKHTEFNTKNIKQSALKWGANKVVFKTMQIYDQSKENLAKWQPKTKAYRRVNKINKNDSRIICWRALTNAVYTTDGALVPCCFDKLAEHTFGTIAKNAWGSERRKTFLKKLSNGKIYPVICKNCNY